MQDHVSSSQVYDGEHNEHQFQLYPNHLSNFYAGVAQFEIGSLQAFPSRSGTKDFEKVPTVTELQVRQARVESEQVAQFQVNLSHLTHSQS